MSLLLHLINCFCNSLNSLLIYLLFRLYDNFISSVSWDWKLITYKSVIVQTPNEDGKWDWCNAVSSHALKRFPNEISVRSILLVDNAICNPSDENQAYFAACTNETKCDRKDFFPIFSFWQKTIYKYVLDTIKLKWVKQNSFLVIS